MRAASVVVARSIAAAIAASITVTALITALIPASGAAAEPAPRDAVALLPLDGRRPDGKPDPRLEIYGQPIAVEIARSLGAADIEVVLVGASNPVPERVKLIVDGTITGQGDGVVIALRVRRNSL